MPFPMFAGLLAGAGAKAALVTAAGSVIGAGLNARSVAKTNAQNRKLNDPVYARQRLEAAGFNPGYYYGGYQAPVMQPNQVGSILATGAAAAADQLLTSRQQDIQITQLEQENERLNKVVENHKLRPTVPGIYGHARQGNKNSSAHNSGASGSVRDYDGAGSHLPVPLEAGDRTTTTVHTAGSGGYVNPRVPDAEMTEARYGDLGQEIAGGYNVIADNVYNARLQKVARDYGRGVADAVHSEFAKADDRKLSQVISDVTKGKPKKVRPKARPDGGVRIPAPRLSRRVFSPLYSQY